jgi:hypothetical protein
MTEHAQSTRQPDGCRDEQWRPGRCGHFSEALTGRRFRLNPAYQLIEAADLDEVDRLRFGMTRVDSELPCLLVPATGGLSVKAVCRATARFLAGMHSPRPVPPDVVAEVAAGDKSVLRLLLDGTLEVDSGEGFVSGPAAVELLELAAPPASQGTRLGALSLQALQYGQALPLDSGPHLSARMYFYNRMPVTPEWTSRLRLETDCQAYTGFGPGTVLRARLDREWIPAPAHPGWLCWRRRGALQTPSPFKLYISPCIEDLPFTFRVALDAFAELAVPCFKIGRDLPGLLRPDKFIAYLPSHAALEALAATLRRRLGRARAHGTPFSAEIDPEGLLSWGMDPPREAQLSSWQGTSWRRWVTDCLALALIAARHSPPPHTIAPWRFALQRLALEGVNTQTWAPQDIGWNTHHASP